jgi:hypothetical protein
MSKKVLAKPYSRMTKAERKVAIAKDVIANLHIMTVKSHFGYIVEEGDKINIPVLREFGIDDQLIARKAKEKCTVCARGAMMLCKIDKFNHFTFDKCTSGSSWSNPAENFDDITQDDTSAALADAFSTEELENIEACFEVCIADNKEDEFENDYNYDNYYGGFSGGKSSYDKAYDKYQKHWEAIDDDKDRLMAIMQNIIDHKGEFKPEVPYVVYYK